ncbi:MAG: FAD-dependent oxidoreductase [Candidatus Eremiobacteraeota bacterium]|nr:FAD-dependent oxidoreductase [Candidatus Eremiobacteraeota bacterium]
MALREYDVVIVGASFGGVAAALAAAKDSKVTVALLERSSWIGGQATSQGVTRWDEAGVELIETVGSTRSYRDVRNAIRAWYRANAPLSSYGHQQVYFNPGFAKPNYPFAADPAVTHQILTQALGDFAERLDVRRNTTVASVIKSGASIAAVTTTSGDTYRARVFLDATDLGELLPKAETPWVIGAESQADTGEPDAPSEAHPEWIQPVTVPIALEHRPPGESDLIPSPPDFAQIVQQQNFRVVDGDISGVFTVLPGGEESLFGYRQYIDARNFAGGDYAHDRTTLNVGSNDYQLETLPTNSVEGDARVYEAARRVSIAYACWLQTQCPRDDRSGRGYPNLAVRTDAFGTNDGCAPQAYIRESRRIDPLRRVVQQDIDSTLLPKGAVRARLFDDSCGIGWYGIDVHPASGPGTPWRGFGTLRFQIPLGALLPKQLDNFVAACKNIGATHLTSGAYRVHPVEWAIGEAAGVLAAFCATQNVTPKTVWNDVDRRLAYQYRLLARGVPIFWWSDVLFDANDPRGYAAAHICGIKELFAGEGGLAFVPAGRFSEADQQVLDGRLGRTLDWPSQAMTRIEAAIFICEHMGWPIA